MSPHPPYSCLADWPLVRLGDVTTKIGSGSTPRGGADSYLPARESFALIRSQCVFDRWLDRQSLSFISDSQAAKMRYVALEAGDILLNITGDGVTFGRAALAPIDVLPAVVNQHVAIVRADPDRAVPGYLLSYLTHPATKTYMGSFSSGGSRRAVTKGHIESFVVPMPPLEIQQQFDALLGTMDAKIESNLRAVRLQRDLAISLIAAAARHEVCLADVATIRKGLSYKGEGLAVAGNGTPMVNMGSAASFGWLKREGLKYYTGDFKPKHLAEPGSLIITGVEQTWKHEIIGWPLLVPDDMGQVLFTHHMLLVQFNEDCEWMRLPLWAHLYSPSARATVESLVYGTTVATLPVTGLDATTFKVPDPGSDAIPAAESLLRRAWALERESQKLVVLRDALLLELLSGRLQVSDTATVT